MHFYLCYISAKTHLVKMNKVWVNNLNFTVEPKVLKATTFCENS